MTFWAVILTDSFLPGATLGLGHTTCPINQATNCPSQGTFVGLQWNAYPGISRNSSPHSHLHSEISQKPGQVPTVTNHKGPTVRHQGAHKVREIRLCAANLDIYKEHTGEPMTFFLFFRVSQIQAVPEFSLLLP